MKQERRKSGAWGGPGQPAHPLLSVHFGAEDYMPRPAKPAASDWPEGLVAVVDSREQLPYSFPVQVVAGLPTGDYSIVGSEDRLAIERKSLADLYGCVGTGRERFKRELERLSGYVYGCVVVECSLEAFLASPPERTAIHPRAAIGSVISWSVHWRVPWWWCGSRALAMATTRKIMVQFSRHHAKNLDTGAIVG